MGWANGGAAVGVNLGMDRVAALAGTHFCGGARKLAEVGIC